MLALPQFLPSSLLLKQGATYDAITRVTTFNVVAALSKRLRLNVPFAAPKPPPVLCFVSAAEAGWPEVSGGAAVEKIAPSPLGRYLVAKRAVEAELIRAASKGVLRPVTPPSPPLEDMSLNLWCLKRTHI